MTLLRAVTTALLMFSLLLVVTTEPARASSTYTPPRTFTLPSDPDLVRASLLDVMTSRATDHVFVIDTGRRRVMPLDQPNEGYLWSAAIIPSTETFYSSKSFAENMDGLHIPRSSWETDLDLAFDEVRSDNFYIGPSYETLTQAEIDQLPCGIYYTGEVVDERKKQALSKKNFFALFFYSDQEAAALEVVGLIEKKFGLNLSIKRIDEYLVILLVEGRAIIMAASFIRADRNVYVSRARMIKAMTRSFGLLGSQARIEDSNTFEGTSMPHWTPLDLCIAKTVLTAGQSSGDTLLPTLDQVASKSAIADCYED